DTTAADAISPMAKVANQTGNAAVLAQTEQDADVVAQAVHMPTATRTGNPKVPMGHPVATTSSNLAAASQHLSALPTAMTSQVSCHGP
ncbi:MAG: hypothetical protein AAGG72_09850, partial [Pseudomonadota bacterium]